MKDMKIVVDPIFKDFKKKSITGIVRFRFKISGNKEPDEFDIQRSINKIGIANKFVMRSVNAIYDGESFTNVLVECYDVDTFFEHVENLEENESPKELLNALNEAIMMLDDYNNMFGDTMNKTEILIRLDEVLKKHQ